MFRFTLLGFLRGILPRASALFNRIPRRVKILVAVITITSLVFVSWLHFSYPVINDQINKEEEMFWKKADSLTLEDRSALLNYIERTGNVPRVLPWWEYDRHMCTSVVVKYIRLFTGVKFFQTSAWQVRKLKTCKGCVSNRRKQNRIWDATREYDENGMVDKEDRERLINQVKYKVRDTEKFYMIGLLWSETTHMNDIKRDGQDINSHVGLIVRGKVLHFMGKPDNSDPLIYESMESLFADGKLNPIWISEIHTKTRAYAPKWQLRPKTGMRLPKTDRELSFTQHVWPWEDMRYYLVFPSKPWFAPGTWHKYFAMADSVVEKTLLHNYRNGYDPYPTHFVEVKHEKEN